MADAKIVSFIVGGAVGAAIMYAINNKKIRNQDVEKLKMLKETQSLKDALETKSDKYKRLEDVNTTLLDDVYDKLTNIHMFADICNTCDETRDRCFAVIDQAREQIKEHVSSNEFDRDVVNTIITEMEDMLRTIINSDDDCDCCDEVITPKSILTRSVSDPGGIRIFDTSGVEFDILDSDAENDRYFIRLEEKDHEEMYNFFHKSVVEQQNAQYARAIDIDAFEESMKDISILMTLTALDDDRMIVTEFRAEIPFEVFSENGKFYYIEGGELIPNDIIQFARSSASREHLQTKHEMLPKNCDSKETEDKEDEETIIEADLALFSQENIDFLAETVGFSKSALNYYIPKLSVLKEIDESAYETVYKAFTSILQTVYNMESENLLDEESKQKFRNALQCLIQNMKKNYGNIIKNHK